MFYAALALLLLGIVFVFISGFAFGIEAEKSESNDDHPIAIFPGAA